MSVMLDAEMERIEEEYLKYRQQRKRGSTRIGDPAYPLLFDDITTMPVIYSHDCYICNDHEFAQMGLPLCRICPACGGHIAADDTRCDSCGLCDQSFYESLEALSVESSYSDLLTMAAYLFWSKSYNHLSAPLRSVAHVADALRKELDDSCDSQDDCDTCPTGCQQLAEADCG